MIERIFIGAGITVFVLLFGLAVWMRSLEHDPKRWHVVLWEASRTGDRNDYFLAPASFDLIAVDRRAPLFATDARTLMWRIDAIANNQGAKRIAGSVDELHATYVEQSRVFAFPDYITVRAIEEDGGSTLMIWSRARFGSADMGVNRKRIENWMRRLERLPKKN